MFSTFLKLLPTHSTGLLFCTFMIVLTGTAHAQTEEPSSLLEIRNLVEQKQMPQALEKAERYIVSMPKDAEGYFTKGVILTAMNRSDEAMAVFTSLTENFPEFPEPYNNLAVLYAQQHQYDKARTALEMAIRVQPDYAVAYENLGDVHAKLASQAYEKAAQLDTLNQTAQTKRTLIWELINPSKALPPSQP